MNFYERLRFSFSNYFRMMRGKYKPEMVEDLLNIVMEAEKETKE